MPIAYIDAQNVHKGIQDLGRIIDWEKLFGYLKKKFNTQEIKIFFGYIQEYESFYARLRDIGYTTIFKDIVIRMDGTIKGNVDVDLVMEVMHDFYKHDLEKAYILSGDSDFNTLVSFLRFEGKLGRVLVPFFGTTGKYLRKSAGSSIQQLSDLEKHLKKTE